MKLAEALMERADLQRRIAQMNGRLNNNARVQEGEKPAEDPRVLLRELEKETGRLEELIAKINLTNSAALIGGKPLTWYLARRDARQTQLQTLRSFRDAASSLYERARGSEIKIVSTVDVAALQKDLDKRAKELRELDALIQNANWSTDLLEG